MKKKEVVKKEVVKKKSVKKAEPKKRMTAEQIIQTLIDNAKKKLSSRYVLGLERALDSVKRGSPDISLQEQKDWIDASKRK